MNELPSAKMGEQAALTRVEPSVAEMLQAVVTQGVTSENVAAIEKLVGLYERMEAKKAEQAYAIAFNSLQKEMPQIVATSVIPNRGKYERFEDVMLQVKPLLDKNGFTVSFSQVSIENRTTVVCTVRHTGGHATVNSFTVRGGGKADSETQADCKAATTAKRNAFLQAFNIVIRQDYLQNEDDPRNEGTFITPEQASDLEYRVNETHSDAAKFLALAGAKSFETIMSGKYNMLDAALAKKERAQ